MSTPETFTHVVREPKSEPFFPELLRFGLFEFARIDLVKNRNDASISFATADEKSGCTFRRDLNANELEALARALIDAAAYLRGQAKEGAV